MTARPDPDAVQRFARDGALVLGGARAILLQLADPVVGRAVARYSRFAEDPMARLRATLTFAYAAVLGDAGQRDAMARYVGGRHAGVPGADDPARQLWVAATLYDTAERMHRALSGPLPEAIADEVYARYAVLGTSLQLPEGAWPRDRRAFRAYWREALGALEVTDEARAVCRQLLWSRALPLWARLAMPVVRVVTIGTLPRALRDAYGLRHAPARFRLVMGALRTVLPLLPRAWREAPSRHYLRQLDRTGAYSPRMR